MRIGTSSCLFSSSTVLALGSNSRHIGAIIRLGLHLNCVWVAFELHSDCRCSGMIVIQFIQIDFVVEAYIAQY